ncbi:MAG: 2OG-Fe dioxygenase family protein [Leptothrix sp. (in: b-proteobacteria)]
MPSALSSALPSAVSSSLTSDTPALTATPPTAPAPYPHTDPLGADQLAQAAPCLQTQGFVRLSAAAMGALAGSDSASLQARLNPGWSDLPPDAHLKDGGRYRRRRHSSYVQDLRDGSLRAAAHRPHWQPTTYNALHGGMLRWFEPLDAALADSPAFQTLLERLGEVFAAAARRPNAAAAPAFDGRWFIEAHAFRIDTTGGVGRPTPEGAHRDGVDFVAVLLIDRVGVVGGETRVFANDGPLGVRFTLTEPWSALLLDDARVIHESTPIQPLAPATPDAPGAHRDTLVLTYRAGGFQDPPAVAPSITSTVSTPTA